MNTFRIAVLAVAVTVSLHGELRCAAITSAQSGPWSLPGTWSGAAVPTASDTVTIQPGHTVTVDITTATAGATTVNGTLKFSRVVSSSFTLVAGDLTIASGGTLDMGTQASPIPSGINAHLVLAKGASDGQFGLTVAAGGAVTTFGANKAPYTPALSNSLIGATSVQISLADSALWSVGDTLVLGPNNPDGVFGSASVESRVITSISGAGPVTLNWSGGLSVNHFAGSTTFPFLVADLDRNVRILSSGTVSGRSYITNQASSAASFHLVNTQLSRLRGAGLVFSGGTGIISSCTIHAGEQGLYMSGATGALVEGTVIYSHSQNGLTDFNGVGNKFVRNLVLATSGGVAIEGSTNQDLIEDNYFFSSDAPAGWGGNVRGLLTSDNNFFLRNYIEFNLTGLFFDGGSCVNCPLVGNKVSANGSGILLYRNNGTRVLAGNDVSFNGGTGVVFDGNFLTLGALLAGDSIHANSGNGITAQNFVYSLNLYGVTLGAYPNTSGAPDGGPELSLPAGTGAQRVAFYSSWINPASGMDLTGLNIAKNYLYSFDHNTDTGSVRFWGNDDPNAPFTLDNGLRLFTSSDTAGPLLLRGSGHSIANVVTHDATTLNEAIWVTALGGGNWRVEGSSSGLINASFACASGPCAFSSSRVDFTLTPGGTVNVDDTLLFVTLAASPTANIRKKLLFGPAAAGFYGGRSKLEFGSSAALTLSGASGSNVLVGMLPGGTYYTIVDSGAFTSNFSSITNLGPGGLELSGSGPISMNNTTFDYMGLASGTNAYITARSLASTMNPNNMTFAMSRSSAGFQTAYNIRVTGNDTGLNWTINAPSGGTLWGEAFNDDPNNKVTWGSANSPPASPSIASVFSTSATITYGTVGGGGYVVDASTAANFTGALVSSATADILGTSLSPQNLTPNTTYFLRAGALWGSTTFYANATPVSTMTLAATPSPLTFTAIGFSGFTINWPQNSNPNGTQYQVAVSTDINFGAIAVSSNTATLSLIVTGLTNNTTYFARVRAINGAGTPTSYALGAVVTVTGVITVSANRLANIWYSGLTAIFNAQGAVTYHYKVTANPADQPGLSDPVFDGSALSTTVLQGISYFHVWGRDSLGASLGYAHFGPIESDGQNPTIASVSAQVSPIDATVIANGGMTTWPYPRFSWPAAVSASPIVGYAFTLSADPLVVPATVNTTLTFTDQNVSASGLYYAKVRAFNLAGTLGPAASMTLNFNSVPPLNSTTLRSNYFRPLRGECARVDIQSASAGRMKIAVYTLLGQKVAEVASQDVGPGNYNFSWCGRNSAGEVVAAGGYFLRVEAPGEKKTHKLMVAK